MISKILKEGKWTWENRFSPFPFSRRTVIIYTNVRHPKLKFTHLVCCFEHCCVFLPVKSFKLHAHSGDGKEGICILIWSRLLSGEPQKGGSRWKPQKQGSPHIEGHGKEEKGGPGRAWSPSPWRSWLGLLSCMKTMVHFRSSELKLESLIPTEQARNLKQNVIILEFKRYIPVRKAHAS